jgi:hypothetical protein
MKTMKCDYLSPRPVKPEIVTIAGGKTAALPRACPVNKYANDAAPGRWLVACPVEPGAGEKLAAAIAAGGERAAEAAGGLRLLGGKLILKRTWPQFADAIDLHALGGGKPETRSVLLMGIDVPSPLLVRVCIGAAGMNVAGEMWINGQAVAHGQFVRLGKGRHAVVVEAYHGHRGQYIDWKLARLSPRFTEVTTREIDEVHDWRLSLWQAERDAVTADAGKLLASVKIDESTIRGRDGFFRVARSVNGRWWFVDPRGRAFYYTGITGLNNGGTGGRRAHKPRVKEARVRQWMELLRQWRYTGMGAWTTSEFFGRGMPFTEVVEGYYVKPWLKVKFPDVFDPRWRANVGAKCKRLCPPLRNNRDCVGYFLENERGFMELQHHGERLIVNSPAYRYAGAVKEDRLVLAAEPDLNTRGLSLLQFALSLKPSTAAYRTAWEFVLKRHGDLKGLGRAWGIDLGCRDQVRRLTANEILLIGDGYQADQADFVKLWVARHHGVMIDAIRKYDSNHLILGMRWGGGPPAPATGEAERQLGEVYSQNCYQADLYETYEATYREMRMPMLNGEYGLDTDSYSLVRNPIEPPGGYSIDERRELRIRHGLDRVFAHRGVVGMTRYRWHGVAVGGGEVRWANVPEIFRINSRAVPLAVASDRPAGAPKRAPHGQYFLTLHGGSVFVDTLPAWRKGEKDSYRVRSGNVRVGVVCRHGRWEARVYGDGIDGELTEAANLPGGRVRLAMKVRITPTLFTAATAKATYVLDLRRDASGAGVEGTFTGRYEGHEARGHVVGGLFRPAATVNC